MRLHLVRHGETITSGRTFAGRSDVPLNSRGKAQAREIAQSLAPFPIARIFASPLSRAVDTARPLAQALGIEPSILPDLTEFDFGDYEGRSKHDLDLTLRKTHARAPVPGGESLYDVWTRAGQVLRMLALLDLAGDSEVALIGHFWINRLLFGRAVGLDFEKACRSRCYRPSTGSAIQVWLHSPKGDSARR